MERMLSNSVNISFTLAAYCIMDPNDPILIQFFTEAELQEISATVASIRLRVEDLDEDEKGFLGIMKKLIEQAGRRLTLPGLQVIADKFMSNFKDFVHRQLLVWANESSGNFAWLCEQPQCSCMSVRKIPWKEYNMLGSLALESVPVWMT